MNCIVIKKSSFFEVSQHFLTVPQKTEKDIYFKLIIIKLTFK